MMKLNFTKPPNCVQSDCVEFFFPSALRVSVDPSLEFLILANPVDIK